ncbi:hypothetical protein [Novacetimonas hansenii]|uniref:Uncharacterized protein n=1 Tax=Novacetimonas hansenii TaxID=436 RepID=A0AAW5EML0_NOVHA|nr:hypothetical protein [Novacetimonas hansenii]MCJ8352431.1 hypothetical protein [Novacetimonas hansenii]
MKLVLKSFRRRCLFEKKGGTQKLFLFFIKGLFSNNLLASYKKIIIPDRRVIQAVSYCRSCQKYKKGHGG